MTRERIVIHSSPLSLWGLLEFAFRGPGANNGQARLSHMPGALLGEQVALSHTLGSSTGAGGGRYRRLGFALQASGARSSWAFRRWCYAVQGELPQEVPCSLWEEVAGAQLFKVEGSSHPRGVSFWCH